MTIHTLVVYDCSMQEHSVPPISTRDQIRCSKCDAIPVVTFPDMRIFDVEFEQPLCNPGRNCPTWDHVYGCRCNVEEIEMDWDDGDCPAECPKCGAPAMQFGYGLAGGGCGAYQSCEWCGYWHKDQDVE